MARLGRSLFQRAVILRNRALALANTGGGQADETVVSVGNSAAGGTAWDVVTIGADATFVYDAEAGNTWYRVATAATTTVARAEWTTASLGLGGWNRYFGRLYFRIPAAALGTTTFYLFRARSGTTQSSRISVSTGNKVQIRNTGNSSAAQGAVDIAADTSYRLEWDITVGAATTGVVRLYAGDSTTPLETITASATDFGTGLVDEFGFGMFTSTANHPTYWMRGFQVNNAAPPGPLGDLSVIGSSAGADTITLADTVARSGVTRARPVAEAVAAADSVTATTARARAGGESIALADAVARAVTRPRPTTDTITLADTAARAAFVRTRTIADTITLADTVTRLVARTRAGAESVTLADQTARAAMARTRTIADAVVLADAVAAASGNARGVTDALTAADTAARGPWLLPRPIADAVVLADALGRGVLVRTRTIADTLTLADASSGGDGPPLIAAAHSIADTTPPATIRRTG